MKKLAVSLASFVFIFAATLVHAQSSPSLETDKTSYEAGETITFTGANWSPGEPVSIVLSADGANESATIHATADASGSFTATATMPDADAASSTTRPIATTAIHTVAPTAASPNANYHAVATGAISHASAQAEFTEGEPDTDGARLLASEPYWFHRITFPTGRFNPEWVRKAADQDKHVPRGTPKGKKKGHNSLSKDTMSLNGRVGILTLSDTGFTSLGPQPERMTGCTGCYDYGTTEGRINDIVIDPLTTTNGSIVAYAGSVGGGVWKTTNCCGSSTTWSVVTDDPLLATISIDSITLDPNNHNIIYAGTGDLNYGSFSMGSQGILKSTDAGAHWTVLGADVFGAALPEPAGQFPQYQAVGKVRVDPNNSNRVAAGTKTGLYLSYDGGVNWTGPCLTNSFNSMRQDITALELTSNGDSTTRIIAAVGVRGFATTVQFDLGNNGANGLYKATMPSSGCPSFTSIAGNANGFVNGASNMNAGSGTSYVNATTGNQLGRIDIGIAPSNPNVIYAQVQSITANTNSGCGSAAGCQLGVWVTTNGGTSWTIMGGSTGAALRNCSNTAGDYPQNWYDQGVAVDPNNPDRVIINTFDTFFATRTGTAFFDLTCGYDGTSVASHVVHTDHHAQVFVPGRSDILLIGDDGGIHGTTNANVISATVRPTWVNMDTGINAIEFYSGDISGNFANAANPQASGGAQDNGPSSVTFNGSPTAPAQWQMGLGGDGFFSRIDPVGTGTNLRFWQGNNSGGLSRCITNCTASGATWTSKRGAWTGDTQSFILPFDLFHGDTHNPANDCGAAGAGTGCGHLIAGTVRVWETITGAAANSNGTVTWYVNSPANLTKQTLGNRSFINQLTFEPSMQSVVIVGTNDGAVQIGRNMGTGSNQSIWTNVTGNNAVLPNRPVLDVAFDPTTTTAPIAYAAVGGFNANTPSTPGHVFRVVCTTNCASFTWTDKSGNLPDIPVDSIIANPNFAPQVFAGTDFGLYYTDDITANPPFWQRFNEGLPNVMIWDMQIDRGATTLSLWTRSRGAYVWPLPQGPENPLPTLLDVTAVTGTYGGSASVSATLTSGGNAIAGKSIAFTFNGTAVGTASTDVNGVATLANASLAGINAGSYATGAGASLAADGVYAAATGTDSLTVSRLAITVSAVPDTKVYDGGVSSAASPAISPALIGTDTSGFTQTFDTKSAGSGKTLTASGSVVDGNSGNNYFVTFVSNASGAISRKPVTGSVTASNKVYDGNTTASIATRTLSGVIGADDVAYSGGSATFADKNAGTGKTVTATGLGLTGPDADNYSVNDTASTTADITQRPITVTATSGQIKTYGGADPAAFAYTVTTGSLVAGDSFSGALSRVAGEDAGSYAITQGSLTAGPNYSLTFVSAPFVITKAAASSIVVTGYTGVYDGNAHGATGSAIGVNGENLTGLLNLGASFTNVPGGTANWFFAGDANYQQGSGSVAIVITPATLTVTANSASRMYSYANPAFTASYSGFKNGETLTTSGVTGSPALTTVATAASAPGQYPIVPAVGTLTANNYSFAFVNGTLTVYLSGIVGVDSASIGSTKAVADSFDSTGGYDATQGKNVLILSNGHIDINGAKVSGNVLSARGDVNVSSNAVVSGDVTAGTSITNQGSIGGSTVANHLSDAIVAPPVGDCGAFTINPAITGNFSYVNGDLSVSGGNTVTLANGTYCFRSVSLTGNSTLQVSGPVVIKVTGPIKASGGSFVNSTSVPSNLQLASSYSGADGVTIAGGAHAYLTLYAPGTSVTISGGSPVFGAVLGKTLAIAGNSQVHYDTTLPAIWSGFFGF